QSTAEQHVIGDTGCSKQLRSAWPARPRGLDAIEAGSDCGTLHDEMIVDIGPAHSKSNRFAKMRSCLVALVESLVGGADIVMAGGVVRIDRNGLGEISNGLGVARALLRHQTQKIHAVDMRRLARQDFLAETLSRRQVADIEVSPRFNG